MLQKILNEDMEYYGSAIACTIFPNLRGGKQKIEDRLFVTAGNNGKILIWDLGTSVVVGGENDCGVEDPCTLFFPPNDNLQKQNETTETTTTEEITSTLSNTSIKNDDDQQPPKVLFGISHPHKPNWMVCSSIYDVDMSNTLFVCDTSCEISAYTLPCR